MRFILLSFDVLFLNFLLGLQFERNWFFLVRRLLFLGIKFCDIETSFFRTFLYFFMGWLWPVSLELRKWFLSWIFLLIVIGPEVEFLKGDCRCFHGLWAFPLSFGVERGIIEHMIQQIDSRLLNLTSLYGISLIYLI